MAQITGKLASILGESINGSVEFALCGYGSTVPRANGVALFSVITEGEIAASADGTFEAELFGNDQIVPAGTYYTATVKNKNGDIVQVNAYMFFGANTYDLDVIDPYDPSQPPPPLPPLIINQLFIVPFSSGMTFDGSQYTAFKTTLTGDTEASPANMLPGNLYTFIIVQDSVGGHSLAWAWGVNNAAPINPAPNSMTIQTFVCDEVGGAGLLPIGGGTYWP